MTMTMNNTADAATKSDTAPANNGHIHELYFDRICGKLETDPFTDLKDWTEALIARPLDEITQKLEDPTFGEHPEAVASALSLLWIVQDQTRLLMRTFDRIGEEMHQLYGADEPATENQVLAARGAAGSDPAACNGCLAEGRVPHELVS